MKNKRLYPIVLTLGALVFGWIGLTLWAEGEGPAKTWHLESKLASKKVLILFDPDPIYNLDEQVCTNLGKGLMQKNVDVTIATVGAVDSISLNSFDGYVLCANTYNWAPDWAITRLIESNHFVTSKPVVAITLGSGSTKRSHAIFQEVIRNSGGIIIFSTEWWLMRPNDESRMTESNVDVARSIANKTGIELAATFLTFSKN